MEDNSSSRVGYCEVCGAAAYGPDIKIGTYLDEIFGPTPVPEIVHAWACEKHNGPKPDPMLIGARRYLLELEQVREGRN